VTFTYVLTATPLGQAIALGIAILLNQKIKAQAIFRTIFYLPAIVSGVAVAVVWLWIFHPEFGLINLLLKIVLGIKGPAWLASTTWALPSFVIMSCWGVGATMVIYLAALQSVPEHLYDAAEIDGSGAWGKFLHVTLPMISPAVFFNLTMGMIGGFQTFASAFIMTGGGPVDATLFYNLYLYENAYQNMRMGYAAAMAWVMFFIILAFTLLQFWGSRHWVYYEGRAN
jgi:multiple sugar transport system permease protein